jgi:hypothetical protein
MGFAERGGLGVLVQFNVSAEGQPFVEIAMVDEQNPAFFHHEYRDGEINFLMDMGHAGETLGRKA